MPTQHVDPVQSQPVATKAEFDESEWSSALYINEPGTVLFSHCPCGCGTTLRIPLCQGTKEQGMWLWDGNREQPTLDPSIRLTSGCFTHVNLSFGVWHFASDSGHQPS